LPLGVSGELYIGGAGVAAGYINQPSETSARFVADPFSSNAGARLYRTGDLTRYLPGGNIEFVGRVDFQVKIRGYRVELGEIEAVIASHPQVRQAVVVVRNDKEDQKLVAYVVNGGGSIDEELRRTLREALPDYMTPAAFVYLRALPLTPNGKVDRQALPAPEDVESSLQRSFVAPRTRVEADVARIWASVLKIEVVGVHDNFFDLGGHSLMATQVLSRMRKHFNADIQLRSIFESPTVAELAAHIESVASESTADLLANIELLEGLSDEEAQRLLELEENRS
jgi:non-ribosomal peptide synthetase component F